MDSADRSFQIFAKPVGAACNLACSYCYYLEKAAMYTSDHSPHMADVLLEEYIVQHMEASMDGIIRFSWHGGEPTLFGLAGFRRIVDLQRAHRPAGRRITNGLMTNGILLDDEWCRFLARENFSVGISMDGPAMVHDQHRLTRQGGGSFEQTMRGFERLRKYGVKTDILCVVNRSNVQSPLDIYRFYRQIGATYITFLPLVLRRDDRRIGPCSVPSAAFGKFLCGIFDEWLENDIGRIKVQIFEEAARTAFGLEHALCIFRETCGRIPVVERNGDVYSCDHFVDREHRLGNIVEIHLSELLEDDRQKLFGLAKRDSLTRYCRECPVLSMCHGGCPKNRFIQSPDGEPGLNYLCEAYRRFFSHCQPWVEQIAAQWRRQNQ